ncbi:uncharacterized protein LOC126758715 isoform X1 [Bactrocera neohumeralis]|uniref:uncharacterized protein LOC126758715 isoform X1 n=1 Tax=Bactrocera neohumeralis TaxID=98809 RepID=UPI002166371B|nr:uncharacterized protein LOC126758715 isoform X1 [Bactrocera neohumeralis]
MKFLEYGEDFLFDDMPKVYNPTQKVFITRLYGLNQLLLPKRVPKIYTSKAIAWRMKIHFNTNKEQILTDDNFVYLDPTKNPHILHLSDEKRVKVFVFEEVSATRNMMVLIQKEGKITHMYGGACVFLRQILLNDVFVSCIGTGVDKLYMDLKRALIPCNPNELNDIIDELDRLLHKSKVIIKIQLLVEPFGSEEFVAELGNQLRGLVHLNDAFLNYNGHFLCLEHFQMDPEMARIFVEHSSNKEECAKHCHNSEILVTVKLTMDKRKKDKSKNYFEIHYSPLPSPFNLKVLASAVYPAHIFGITYGTMEPPTLPEYLRGFCSVPGGARFPKKSRLRPADSAKPLPPEKISPNKDTPAHYCIRKQNFEYVDDESNDES